jgi:WD40 repeat protein
MPTGGNWATPARTDAPEPRESRVVDGAPFAAGVFHEIVIPWRDQQCEPQIDPTFHWIASFPDRKTIAIFDRQSRKRATTLPGHDGSFAQIQAFAFSSQGDHLAAGSYQGIIRLWETKTGRLLWETKSPDVSQIWSLAISPDQRLLATGPGRAVQLWEIATGKKLRTLEGNSTTVMRMAFSPDAKYLTAADENTVVTWDLATSKVHSLVSDTDPTAHFRQFSVAYAADSKRYVIGGGNGIIRLWDMATSDEIGTARILTSGKVPCAVQGLAFSSDGKLLATAHDDGCIGLWDAASLRALIVFNGHPGGLRSVTFSPDGALLASAAKDGSVRFWDVAKLAHFAEQP